MFFSSILSVCFNIASHVLLFAKTGTLYFFEKVPNPFVWSRCSCVTIIASIVSGSISKEESAVEIFLQLSPASINILVLEVCTSNELPELPLYKLQKLNIILQILIHLPFVYLHLIF